MMLDRFSWRVQQKVVGKNGDHVVGLCEQGEESIDSLIVQRGWLDDGSDIIASYEIGFYTR